MEVNYAPDQPIPFSHKIHAGIHKIECLYCHQNADKSRHATVPAMNVCMGCHTTIATDRPNIKKMTELYNKGESFEWVKIHDLPEHVYFPHRKHVAAGVSCQSCHGEIEKMDVVKQEHEITMGFCIKCHRDNNYVDPSQGVGQYNYAMHNQTLIDLGDSSKYKKPGESPKPLAIHPITHMNATTECSACHQ